MKAFLTAVSAGFLWFGSSAHGAFEVTPLDTAESRSNAAAFWSANGCAPFGTLAVMRAMEHYYAQPAPAPFVAKRYASAKDITSYYQRLVSLDPFANKWSFVSIGTNDFKALATLAAPRGIAGSDARAGARAP